MIEPIALYCAPIYPGITSYINKLTNLEDKGYRIINCTKPKSFDSKIKERTATEVFKYLNKIKNNEIITFSTFNHSIGTRGNGNRLIIPKSINEAGRKSFTIQGALAYNMLPVSTRNQSSLCMFKRDLKDLNPF